MKSLRESILDVDDNIEDQTIADKYKIQEWLLKYSNVTIFDDYDVLYKTYFKADFDEKTHTVTVKHDLYLDSGRSREPYSVPTDLFHFGDVKGSFDCSNSNITSLEGCPNKVGGDYNCFGCPELKSLKGCAERVAYDLYCEDNVNLVDLKGAPKYVGGRIKLNGCTSLKTLKGLTPSVRILSATRCTSLVELGVNLSEMRHCNFNGCTNLRNVKGLPNVFKGDLSLLDTGIINFKDFPESVIGDVDVVGCKKLKDLKYCPTNIEGDLRISFCPLLHDPSNWFDKIIVDGDIYANNSPIKNEFNLP